MQQAPLTTLSHLLSPLPVEEFIARHWEQRCVFIPGTADKFGGLFDLERFHAICGETRSGPGGRRPYVKAGFRDAAGEHAELFVQPSQIDALVHAGMTIQAELLETVDSKLAALVDDARRTLGVAADMDVGCFLSPDRSGYALHFDATSMWTIQIEGQKRWRYSPEPAVSFPPENYVPRAEERAARVHGFEEASLVEHVLSPGDVLYLPPGAWHRAEAIGRSLHLSLTVRSSHVLTLVDDALRPVLDAPAWRRLPTGDDGAIERSLSERLIELRAAVGKLSAADLVSAWRKRANRSEPHSRHDATVVNRGDRLRRNESTLIATDVAGGEVLVMLDGALVASLPPDANAFACALAVQGDFTASDAIGWDQEFEWEDISAVLSTLVELGALARID